MLELWEVCEKMTEHIKTKRKLKEDIKTFADIMKSPYISEEEKNLLNMIYIDKKDYRLIGDTIGISESTVKKRHKDLIKKISKILQTGL